MVKKYVVSLSEAERQSLEQIVTTGKRSASTINEEPNRSKLRGIQLKRE